MPNLRLDEGDRPDKVAQRLPGQTEAQPEQAVTAGAGAAWKLSIGMARTAVRAVRNEAVIGNAFRLPVPDSPKRLCGVRLDESLVRTNQETRPMRARSQG